MSDNFVFDVGVQSEEEPSYNAPPRTTPLGTEMIFYNSAESECGIDVRSAFSPSAEVEVADAISTAYVGDGRLADVRRRVAAQLRADAIAASGALGFPLLESSILRETRDLEESMAQTLPAPHVTDLRQKIRGKRAAAAGSRQSSAAALEAHNSPSVPLTPSARSTPATALETETSSARRKDPEAAGAGRRRRKRK